MSTIILCFARAVLRAKGLGIWKDVIETCAIHFPYLRKKKSFNVLGCTNRLFPC